YLKCYVESSMAKRKSTSTPMTCKPREIDIRTTVYENEDFIYQRHVNSSRTFLSEVEKRFILMTFTL
ncbi:unnamed protein product, partial [Adineta ricciae]